MSSQSKHWWQNHLLRHPNSCPVVFVITLTCLFTLHPFLSHTLHFYTQLRSSLEVLHCQDTSHIYLILYSLPSHTPPKHTSGLIPSHTNFVSCHRWQRWPLTSPSLLCFQASDDTTSSVPKSVLLLAALSPPNTYPLQCCYSTKKLTLTPIFLLLAFIHPSYVRKLIPSF